MTIAERSMLLVQVGEAIVSQRHAGELRMMALAVEVLYDDVYLKHKLLQQLHLHSTSFIDRLLTSPLR